jgi:hypothetical protein
MMVGGRDPQGVIAVAVTASKARQHRRTAVFVSGVAWLASGRGARPFDDR